MRATRRRPLEGRRQPWSPLAAHSRCVPATAAEQAAVVAPRDRCGSCRASGCPGPPTHPRRRGSGRRDRRRPGTTRGGCTRSGAYWFWMPPSRSSASGTLRPTRSSRSCRREERAVERRARSGVGGIGPTRRGGALLAAGELPGLALGGDRRRDDHLDLVHLADGARAERRHRLAQRADEVLVPWVVSAGPNRICSSGSRSPIRIRVPRGSVGDGAAMPQL